MFPTAAPRTALRTTSGSLPCRSGASWMVMVLLLTVEVDSCREWDTAYTGIPFCAMHVTRGLTREVDMSGVVVTGAASGIGRASAEALVADGRKVALWDIAPEVTAVADGLGMPGAVVDVCDATAMQGAVGAVTKRWTASTAWCTPLAGSPPNPSAPIRRSRGTRCSTS